MARPLSFNRHSGARPKGANPESRDSPMCNCTSEVWSFGPSRNDGSLVASRRWRLCHRLALRQGGDGGGSDRALFVVEKTLADRDAVGGVVVHHLEADPFFHRQAVQIKRDIAVDVTEALVAGIGKGAGKI